MTADLSHLNSVLPSLMEAFAIASSLAVIFIDWNHNFLERSQLRFLQCYLPQWRSRSARQGSYICLVILALAIIYNNSIKNFAINMQNCLIAGASLVVILSFWLQSKVTSHKTSEKSVGETSVNLKDQGISASTCCGARVPQYPLPTSSTPQSEVNIEEEKKEPYVLAFRTQFDLEEVPEEKLATAIKYLNTLRGGIEAHRHSNNLMNAVNHIDSMGSRLDDSGFPQEYSYEELHHIVVEENKYPFEDFERVLGKCLENSGFLPSPQEFAEIHHDMKGIVQLEREVAETSQALERTQRVVEKTTQVVVESEQRLQQKETLIIQNKQTIQQKDQTIQQKDQTIQQKDQTIQQNQQTIQQKDQIIQMKDRLLHQERQRNKELEQNPEGVLQKRMQELEEENRRLSAQSKRALCKICHEEEVQVSFYPCKHLISCEGCVESLPEKICPMCRKPIQDTVKIYFA